jgi:DNA processing protein
MTSNSEYIWYKLFKTEGVGPKTIHSIYSNCKNSEMNEKAIIAFLNNKKKLLTNWNNIKDELCFPEYEKIIKKNIKIITLDSKYYPRQLINNLDTAAPPLLFCGGKLDLLNALNVSIVGSRDVFKEGIDFTKNIAKQLAFSGYNIVSGYAKGVDTLSHLTALENDGTTTFVLSYGLYDFKKKKEFSDVKWTDNILAMSEFSPESKWLSSHAMIRNKTIVGLSNAVIVVQAGPEKDEKGNMSGTFNSGKTALKYNIPLFVLSPSIVDNAKGNKDLIKQGAIEINLENALETIKKKLSEPTLKKNKPNQSTFNFD